MWAQQLPAPDDNLRQGDLLADVPIPSLTGEPALLANGQPNFKIKRKPCLVISQCCTIERRQVVQIAHVLKTMQLTPEHPTWQGLQSDWPAREGMMMYDAMRLEPVPGTLEELPDGRLWTADFRAGVTFTANPAWLRKHVRARMDPVARRSLRMRLAAFYSRSTDEDRQELDAIGEWADADTAPEWVSKRPDR